MTTEPIYVPIIGNDSENIAFNISDKWADAWGSGSFTESPIAVEQQTDGSYKLAIKNTHQWAFGSEDTQTEIDWNVYDISSSGIIDWNSATYGGITKYEDYFNQDLNGDGGVGINASLTAVSSDTTGAKLKIDPDKALYIDDNGTIVAIVDQWGDAPRLDDSGTWSDRWSTNTWAQESVAVERQSDGSYKLAVKTTNVRNKDKDNEESTTDWQVFTISSSGVLDPISTFGGIVKHEDSFNQDLNGDGGKGLAASLNSVNSDITGEKLKRDGENSLYIDLNDGASPTAILDNQGGIPIFDHIHSWTDAGGTDLGSKKQLLLSNKLMVHLNLQSRIPILIIQFPI